MKRSMAKYILLVIIIKLAKSELDIELKEELIEEPTWVYKCIQEEGCQRIELPVFIKNSSLAESNAGSEFYKSVDVCRTVCGRFGALWPRPSTASLSTQTVKIHPNYLRFDLTNVPAEAHSLLLQMTRVVTSNLLAECGGNVTKLVDTSVTVYIFVKSPNLELTWDTDEQYTLNVQTKGGQVSANIASTTVYGARHALESFAQLIAPDRQDFAIETNCGLRIVAGAKIRDQPAYKHRGFLLDTSRHFIPMNDVKRMIDGMAATKMNVFHWHVTDSHSFPLESNRVPQFTRYGAYSEHEIYRVEEVKELIKYAQIRGVRVLVEIDSPAHAGNGWQWGKMYGLGDLAVCVNADPWRGTCIQPPCGQLNPANPAMYKVLKELYLDLAEILPKPTLLHMGGDEIFFNCWAKSEEITSYMQNKGLNIDEDGFIRLWAEFHAKALQAWDEALVAAGVRGQQPVVLWSSELTKPNRIQKYLNSNRYVIEVWETLESPVLNQLLRLGYRTISVPKDIWYLDHGSWGTTKYSNWRRMYSHMLPKEENMLGGEVAMWSEYVDEQGLDSRVWPRAAAVGERLWSDVLSGPSEAEVRLQALRSRLLARGLRPDVLSPAWCAQHDSKCL